MQLLLFFAPFILQLLSSAFTEYLNYHQKYIEFSIGVVYLRKVVVFLLNNSVDPRNSFNKAYSKNSSNARYIRIPESYERFYYGPLLNYVLYMFGMNGIRISWCQVRVRKRQKCASFFSTKYALGVLKLTNTENTEI